MCAEVVGRAREADAAAELLVGFGVALALQHRDGIARENRSGLAVFGLASPFLDTAQRRVIALEGPGDECLVVAARRLVIGRYELALVVTGVGAALAELHESFVLPLADEFHVMDAVGESFDVPEHHCGAGVHAKRVRDVHGGEPRLGVALAEADLCAHGAGEDLAAAAGQRVEARVAESDHDPAEFLFEVLAGRVEEVDELDEFGRAKAMDVDVRIALFDAVEQVDVPVEGELGIHAALHEDLRAADGREFFDFLEELFVLERVGVVVLGCALEGAEDALGGADVGVVDVAVDDVGAEAVAVDGSAACVGPSAQLEEFLLLEEFEPLLGGEAESALGDVGQEAGVEGVGVGLGGQGLVDGAHAESFSGSLALGAWLLAS